jgi:hypothetical protein
MEQSPLEANSHSSFQEIPRLQWNAKICYRVHKSPSLDTVLTDGSNPYAHTQFVLTNVSNPHAHTQFVLTDGSNPYAHTQFGLTNGFNPYAHTQFP